MFVVSLYVCVCLSMCAYKKKYFSILYVKLTNGTNSIRIAYYCRCSFRSFILQLNHSFFFASPKSQFKRLLKSLQHEFIANMWVCEIVVYYFTYIQISSCLFHAFCIEIHIACQYGILIYRIAVDLQYLSSVAWKNG